MHQEQGMGHKLGHSDTVWFYGAKALSYTIQLLTTVFSSPNFFLHLIKYQNIRNIEHICYTYLIENILYSMLIQYPEVKAVESQQFAFSGKMASSTWAVVGGVQPTHREE